MSWRIVLDILWDKYPNLLLNTIINNKYIKLLLKYSLLNKLDHGNFNSFILELISFQSLNNNILNIKKQIISLFIKWNLLIT